MGAKKKKKNPWLKTPLANEPLLAPIFLVIIFD